MKKEDLIQLSVEQKEDGYILKLDDKELHHVIDYKIEECCSPTHMQGIAKLSLEIMVNQVENPIPSFKEEKIPIYLWIIPLAFSLGSLIFSLVRLLK